MMHAETQNKAVPARFEAHGAPNDTAAADRSQPLTANITRRTAWARSHPDAIAGCPAAVETPPGFASSVISVGKALHIAHRRLKADAQNHAHGRAA
ncbi:hypothetical protein R70241_01522 [Paraburkholderia saeva]|nr:hypothetical protein R70241_01522 [Paraburkholderia saeva]